MMFLDLRKDNILTASTAAIFLLTPEYVFLYLALLNRFFKKEEIFCKWEDPPQ
jgi:hypothetical protein